MTPPTKKTTITQDNNKTTNATPIQIKESTKLPSIFTKPSEIGEKISLGQVLFEQGTITLTTESFSELDNFVLYLNIYPKVRIRLGRATPIPKATPAKIGCFPNNGSNTINNTW